MGKDLSYCIVPKGHKIPQEKNYANVIEYMEALNTQPPFIYFHSFEGEDVPFVDDKMYTRDEMIKSLQEYVMGPYNFDTNNSDRETVEIILHAFGKIISEMDNNNLVIISYD